MCRFMVLMKKNSVYVSRPCQNRGKCIDDVNSYTSVCDPGYLVVIWYRK